MSKRSRSFTHETKGQQFARSFLAFALFLLISVISLTACVRVTFINPNHIVKVFFNDAYVTELRKDILGYTHETLKRNMLPEECLDETVSYRTLREISYAYAAGKTGATEDYSDTAYLGMLDTLAENMTLAINETVDSLDLTTDEIQGAEGAARLAEKIKGHMLKCIEKKYMNKVSDVVKVGNYATIIIIAVCTLFAVLLALIVVSIGRRYRALRYLVHSVNAAALLNLLLVGGAAVVEHTKTLFIYPSYFRASVMSYVHGCMLSVTMSSLLLLFIALILTVVIWKVRRESN